MSRKLSAHGRKLKQGRGAFNGVEFLNAISRCRPYTDEIIPGAVAKEPTQDAAEKSVKLVEGAYKRIQTGQTDPNDADDFNRLAHALGIAEIRAEQIAGKDHASNPMLPILATGNAVLGQVRARRSKWGKWEMLPAEADFVFDALEVYEEILLASSPAQMDDACGKREAWIRLREADRVKAVFDNNKETA